MTTQHYKIYDEIRQQNTMIMVKSESAQKSTVNTIVGMAADMHTHTDDLLDDLNAFDELKAHAVDRDIKEFQITTKGGE